MKITKWILRISILLLAIIGALLFLYSKNNILISNSKASSGAKLISPPATDGSIIESLQSHKNSVVFDNTSNQLLQISPPIDASVKQEIKTTVQIGTKKYDLKPNAIGSYPRLTVPAKAIIPIHLQIKPNESIHEQVLDGGGIDDKLLSRLQEADNQGNLDFKFQVKEFPGSYRLAIYRAGQRQIFDFWVGPDLPQRVISNK